MSEVDVEYKKTELYKLSKKVGFNYTDELRKLSKEQLDNKILELAKYRQSILNTKKDDEELIKAKEKLKELEGPYKDDLKANLEKQRLISLVMQDMGLLEAIFLKSDSENQAE